MMISLSADIQIESPYLAPLMKQTCGFDYLFDNKDIFYLFCKTLARTIAMTRISN